MIVFITTSLACYLCNYETRLGIDGKPYVTNCKDIS